MEARVTSLFKRLGQKKIPEFVSSQGPHWVPLLWASEQQLASLRSLVRVFLFGSDLSPKEGKLLECNRRIQGFMSHPAPPPCRGPGHNLLSSSPGFLLLVGQGVVEQSSLKGSSLLTSPISPCQRDWRQEERHCQDPAVSGPGGIQGGGEAYARREEHLVTLASDIRRGCSSVTLFFAAKSVHSQKVWSL